MQTFYCEVNFGNQDGELNLHKRNTYAKNLPEIPVHHGPLGDYINSG